ncbi:RNA polymerase sigma-70 factor, ECF subfamily [Filimonas lacunae]|nr:RNA polymerase sigma-70 factor, ECF subfamily [Filimonas lacunae]
MVSTNNITYEQKEQLLQVAAGNERAFADFMLAHSDRLYSYILRITKNDHWAQELVQDVWLQVWLARAVFAQLDNPVAYLNRMAQNRSIDWIRRNKRELKAQYIIQQQQQSPVLNTAAENVDLETTRKLLQQAIESLPAQRRRIFEMKQEGLSYDEIAAALHISKNTVRNQMVSALHTLRTFLQEHGDVLLIFFYFFL